MSSSKKSRKQAKRALLSDNVRSENYTEEKETEKVKDKLNLVYWICMLLGCGILIAYNFLLTAADYFVDEFPDYPDIMFYIVPVYTVPDVLFLVACIIWGDVFSFTTQTVICFVITGGILGVLPLFVQIMPQDTGFYIVMGTAALIGVTTAILQSAIISFCNFLPVPYIRVSISGQAVAGISACIIRIGTKLYEQYGGIGAKTSGLIYFIVGAAFDVLCAVLFLYAVRSAFIKFHLRDYFWTRKYRGISNTEKQQLTATSTDLLKRTDTKTLLKKIVDPDSIPTPRAKDFEDAKHKQYHFKSNAQQIMTHDVNIDNDNITIVTRKKKQKKKKKKRTPKQKRLAASLEKQNDTYMRYRTKSAQSESSTDSESDMTTDESDMSDENGIEITETVSNTSINVTSKHGGGGGGANLLSSKPIHEELQQIDELTYLGVFKKIKWLSLAVFLTFFVTFLIFPGMLVSLDSEYSWIQSNAWLPVFLVTEFNVGDFIGRQFFASCTSFGFTKRTLWIGCTWRIFIYPLYIALYQGWIKNDFIAYGATAVLAVTNGHFCCLCFMWVPSLVKSNEQQICGAIMSFSLVMGITVGSNIALVVSFFI